MDRVSQALLGHLHGVFDPDPAPVLALRVRHVAGATWTVAGDTLTLVSNLVWDGAWDERWWSSHGGEAPGVWDLNDYSLATLADAIMAAGFEVVYLNPSVSHLSALTLLEGTGFQGNSNGDHLNIYTSPLAVLLAALGQALGEGRAAIAAALAQLILPNATQEWADLFGEIFGIPRRGTILDSPYYDLARLIAHYNPIGTTGHEQTLNAAWEEFFGNLLSVRREAGESAQHYHDRLVYAAQQRPALALAAPDLVWTGTWDERWWANRSADATEPNDRLPPLETDAAYTGRIIAEVQRSRCSPAAILRNIQRLTGHDLTLWEPWKELHVLSQSPLSGTDHMQGAPIYEYHRIQLVARRGIDWTPVLREAEADRPAGTLMLPPATRMPPLTADLVGLTPILGRVAVWAEELKWNAYGRLSVDLNLSNYLPPPMTVLGKVTVTGIGTYGLRGPYEDFTAFRLTWVERWDERLWAVGSTSAPELYPPEDILAADYEGVFRLNASSFGINDRLQYETSDWTHTLTQLGAGVVSDTMEVETAHAGRAAQVLPYNAFGLLSADLGLSASLSGPVRSFKITRLES